MKRKDTNDNARRIITMDEHGNIAIPTGEVWMGEYEIADLFGVFGHTVRTQVKKIYRDGLLYPYSAERNIKIAEGRWLDAYSLEMVIALAFRINSQRAKRLRENVIAIMTERHGGFVMLLPTQAGNSCSDSLTEVYKGLSPLIQGDKPFSFLVVERQG